MGTGQFSKKTEASMRRDTTLAQAALGDLTLLKQVMLVLAGTLLIAIAAQLSVRIGPVPLSLQGLAVMSIGFAFGARLGAVTVLAYLAQGAMGMPVFSNGGAGLPYLMGPTAGFLIGFVAMAWICGLAADRGLARFAPYTIAAALVASAVIYIPGLAWPAAVMGMEGSALWAGWMAPFLLGDLIKALVVGLAISGGLAALRGRA
jgi:biotin transport system substrate-specific component